MLSSKQHFSDWLWKVAIFEKIDSLQRETLTHDGTHHPSDVLSQVYEKLTDEQKIAFILAGGVPLLSYYQQQNTQVRRTSGRATDTDTGPLSVVG
jgi:hypothetical protein